ncbi:MAG: FtsQ-type POTRA domain-containing protein, partial [Candidatus Andersenbacteria bacterium]
MNLLRFVRRQPEVKPSPITPLQPARRSQHPYQLWFRQHLTPLLPTLSLLLLISIITIPLILFGWLVFSTDTFIVQAITVIDARPHITEAARTVIAEHLNKTPLNKNIFFLPTDALQNAIIAAIPEIETVHVTRKLPGTVKAIVQEKSPALLFSSNAHYYFVDATGIAYEEARLETLPGTELPIVKNSDPEAKVTLGAPVVAESFINFIHYMQENVPKEIGSDIAQIRIPSLSAREVHVSLANNWEIRFDVTRDPARQLAILRQLLYGTVSAEEHLLLE